MVDFDFWRRAIKYFWICSKGYRLCPWRSPYIKWRFQTYFAIPAKDITFYVFFKLLWVERKRFWEFLHWVVEMQRASERRSSFNRK